MYVFFYSISVRPLPSASLSVWFVMMVAMSLYQFYHQPEQVSVLRFATCMSKSQCKVLVYIEHFSVLGFYLHELVSG